MNGDSKSEEDMSPAEWLADSEVAITDKTPDPLAHGVPEIKHSKPNDETDREDDDVRNASESERSRIWSSWSAKFGPAETSRRWLSIFAATDAPRTG